MAPVAFGGVTAGSDRPANVGPVIEAEPAAGSKGTLASAGRRAALRLAAASNASSAMVNRTVRGMDGTSSGEARIMHGGSDTDRPARRFPSGAIGCGFGEAPDALPRDRA